MIRSQIDASSFWLSPAPGPGIAQEFEKPPRRVRLPDNAPLTRDRKVQLLMQHLQEEPRQDDLNRIDADARSSRTWGTSEHRRAREQREQAYEASRTTYLAMSDAQLDSALATSTPETATPAQ